VLRDSSLDIVLLARFMRRPISDIDNLSWTLDKIEAKKDRD
jgi:hypothetical protein